MRFRVVVPLVLVTVALAGCSGGATVPPAAEVTTGPLSAADAKAAASIWSTDLLTETCIAHATTESPENAAIHRDEEVHRERARSGARPDGLWVLEVPFTTVSGEFRGHSASYYCLVGGTLDEPGVTEWGITESATDAQFASYVGGGPAPGFASAE